jgi:hypothetical protein
MSIYIDPTGEPTYGIGICGRCSRKMRLAELFSDPNSPGLKVCKEDLDDYDPYRLAPRREDQIVLPFTRPDTPINTEPTGVITQDGTDFIISEDGQRFLYIID